MVRLANKTDFETFEYLYNSLECDLLYTCSNEGSKEVDFSEFGLELLKDDTISNQDFLDIIQTKNQKILMIENGPEIIGIAWLYSIKKYRWKLYSLCVLPNYQCNLNIFRILLSLLGQEKIKEIDICCISSRMQNLLENIMKAEKIVSSYYRIK